MNKIRNTDPLLLAGKVIAILMQAALLFGGGVLILVAGAILFERDTLIAEYATDAGVAAAEFPTMALVGVMLVGLVIVAALFVFFGKLRQIISSVGEGDPFQPANADRLALMAWIMLGIQLMMLPAAALGMHLARFAEHFEDANITVEGGFDGQGILLVIILFILARVFRHGAAMRDDLEGTV